MTFPEFLSLLKNRYSHGANFKETKFIYNPGKNIWQKVKESSKFRQDQKTLIAAFAQVLTAIGKN